MIVPSSAQDRRELPRYALRIPIAVFDPKTRERVQTETRDVHVRGLYANAIPRSLKQGDEVLVSFLGAPSQLPCRGKVQHTSAEGAGIALHRLPDPSFRFIQSLTHLESHLDGYTITHHLGTGGMSQVYLAENPSGHPVVLKRLLPQFAREPNAVELFTSEAELLSRCQHPGIPAFDTVKQDDDVFFLAMEWIRGVSLDQVLDSVGPLPVAAARSVMLQILRALEHLHGLPLGDGRTLSVHHGDISPQNVMVTPEGRVVLLDLGACCSDLTPRPPGYEILGTLPYMAPEILNGHEPHRASDLWSAGVLFYEMLTGERPFDGDDEFETVEAIVEGLYEPPSQWVTDVGPLEEQVIRRSIWPRPLYATAHDFGNETARDLADTLEERADPKADREALCQLIGLTSLNLAKRRNGG